MKKLMIDAVEKRDRTRELVLKEALVIQRVTEVKEELKKALDKIDTLTVHLEETSGTDLAGLQLLCASHRAASALKKTLIRVGGPEVRGIFAGSGMVEPPGCSFGCDHECVWDGRNAG